MSIAQTVTEVLRGHVTHRAGLAVHGRGLAAQQWA